MHRPSGFLLAQLILCLSLLPAGAEERQPSWLATYDGPGSNATGSAYRLARDASGNLYVAGRITWARQDESFILLKCDPSGRELWRALYDGPGRGPDDLRALAVDGAGNVSVDGVAVDGLPALASWKVSL
jgi:hypothetical protein